MDTRLLFPRVMVAQVLIGKFELADFYRSTLMPTVKAWSDRMGYNYFVLDKRLYDFRCQTEDIIAQRFILFGLFKEYDYLIHVDADVTATDHASYLPLVDFGAVIDAESTAKAYGDWMRLGHPYFNAGIFIISSKMAEKLWIKANHLMAGEYDHLMRMPLRDQNVLNKWIDELGGVFTPLDEKWNTMPHQERWANRDDAYLIHYAGDKSLMRREFDLT